MNERNKRMLKHRGYKDVVDVLQPPPQPQNGWHTLLHVIIFLIVISAVVMFL